MTDNTNDAGPPAAAEAPLPADIEALSYEEAREQLVAVVSKLEAGGTSLEDSLALWERGRRCARNGWRAPGNGSRLPTRTADGGGELAAD